MTVNKGQRVGYEKILNISDTLSLHPFEGFDKFNLPLYNPTISAVISEAKFLTCQPTKKTGTSSARTVC